MKGEFLFLECNRNFFCLLISRRKKNGAQIYKTIFYSFKQTKTAIYLFLGRTRTSTLRKITQVSKVILRNKVSVNLNTLGDFDFLNRGRANSSTTRSRRSGTRSSGTTLEVEVVDGETNTSEEDDGEDALGVGTEGLSDSEGGVVGGDGEGLVLITGGLDEDAEDEGELHGFGVDVRGEGVLDGGLLAGGEDALVGITGEVLVVAVEVVEGGQVAGDEDGGVLGVAFDVVDDDDGFDLFASGDLAVIILGKDSDGTETETEGLFFTSVSVEGVFSTSVGIIIKVVIIFSTDDDGKEDHGDEPES